MNKIVYHGILFSLLIASFYNDIVNKFTAILFCFIFSLIFYGLIFVKNISTKFINQSITTFLINILILAMYLILFILLEWYMLSVLTFLSIAIIGAYREEFENETRNRISR